MINIGEVLSCKSWESLHFMHAKFMKCQRMKYFNLNISIILEVYKSLINDIFICLLVLFMNSKCIHNMLTFYFSIFQRNTIPKYLQKQATIKVQLRKLLILRILVPRWKNSNLYAYICTFWINSLYWILTKPLVLRKYWKLTNFQIILYSVKHLTI